MIGRVPTGDPRVPERTGPAAALVEGIRRALATGLAARADPAVDPARPAAPTVTGPVSAALTERPPTVGRADRRVVTDRAATGQRRLLRQSPSG